MHNRSAIERERERERDMAKDRYCQNIESTATSPPSTSPQSRTILPLPCVHIHVSSVCERAVHKEASYTRLFMVSMVRTPVQ